MNKHASAKAYWSTALREWEHSSYGSGTVKVSFIERLASHFRHHIRQRQRDFLEMAADTVPGLYVVELGCASGYTSMSLLELKARKVVGLDISEQAVVLARQRAKERGLSDDRLAFHSCEIGETFPLKDKADLMVGLGIVEYIPTDVFVEFLQSHGPERLLFSFDEKRWNLQKLLHTVYRMLKGFPFYIKYSQPEMRAVLTRAGYREVSIYRRGANSFWSARR